MPQVQIRYSSSPNVPSQHRFFPSASAVHESRDIISLVAQKDQATMKVVKSFIVGRKVFWDIGAWYVSQWITNTLRSVRAHTDHAFYSNLNWSMITFHSEVRLAVEASTVPRFAYGRYISQGQHKESQSLKSCLSECCLFPFVAGVTRADAESRKYKA